MANHYIAINRGAPGMAANDFTIGTSSSAGKDIELRVADADGQGHALTQIDLIIALRAIERALEDGTAAAAGFPAL